MKKEYSYSLAIPYRITGNLAEINYNRVLSLEVQQDRHEKYLGLSPEKYLKLVFEKAVKMEQQIEEYKY